jgi:DNA-binding beta-propeller fold protein YncE
LRAHLAGLDRPRRIALGAAVALGLAGAVLIAMSPPATVPIRVPGTLGEDAPLLTYVRSLPDAGDPVLERPVGLAVGGGNLYVADSGAGVVRVFTMDGFDAGEVGRGTLEVPAYVARDVAAGTLLVSDRALATVFRFGADGEPLGEIVPSAETSVPWQPLGIAADGEGTVAVTDISARHRVLVMDRTGQVSRTLGGPVSAEASGSVSVALDFPNSVGFRDDELWVGDSNNRRVLVFDANGALVRLVRVDGIARGLAFLEGEAEGDRFVAVVDALTSEIVLLDGDGEEAARYGGPGSSAGRLAYPNDVVFDPTTKQVFVADTGNARVQVWSVTWPGEEPEPGGPLLGPALSPMRLAGIIVVLLGVALGAVAVWPRRAAARELLEQEDDR